MTVFGCYLESCGDGVGDDGDDQNNDDDDQPSTDELLIYLHNLEQECRTEAGGYIDDDTVRR